VDKRSGAARVIREVVFQKYAKRTYLVHARTKPQRLKKININPFVLLSCAADDAKIHLFAESTGSDTDRNAKKFGDIFLCIRYY
jgi:hypothetical protein